MPDQQYGVLCWGSGQFGQHGHAIDEPVTIVDGYLERFQNKAKFISCGASHTIVVTVTNEVFGWGNGQNGQLGCGDKLQHLSPIRMKLRSVDGIKNGEPISAVACGDRHTCILLEDGRLICCGSNYYAQLSYDHMKPRYREDLILPTILHLNYRVRKVACGQYHTVMLYDSGEVACIGRNMYGQIGVPCEDPKYDIYEKPKLLRNTFECQIIEVATGSNHTLCIDEKGNAYCWGYGRACGLRQGHAMNPTLLKSHGRKITRVDGGAQHSILLTENGQILVVGSNTDGQCGLGAGVHFINSPTQLSPEQFQHRRINTVTCGEYYTVAFTDVNHLYLWGKNSHVISEEPLDFRYFEPVYIEKSHYIHGVACGTWHAAALVSDTPTNFAPEGGSSFNSSVPSLISESSSDNVEITSTEDVDNELQRLTSLVPSPIPIKTLRPNIGLQRERTHITLAELYAPTPTTRSQPTPDVDKESSVSGPPSPLSSSPPNVSTVEDIVPGPSQMIVPGICNVDTMNSNPLSSHESTPRNAWRDDSVPPHTNTPVALSKTAIDCGPYVVTNALSIVNQRVCSNLSSDSSSSASIRTRSTSSRRVSAPSSSRTSPSIMTSSITPFTVAAASPEPIQQRVESPAELVEVRVPSPPNVTKPSATSKVVLKRETLTPLNVNGYSHNSTVTEDVFMLQSGSRVQLRRRQQNNEDGDQSPQKSTLNRRPPNRSAMTQLVEHPQPALTRERSLMVPRTLTFILNDKRELELDNSATSKTDSDKSISSAPAKSIRRPAIVTSRRFTQKTSPSLRRSYTTLTRTSKY